MPVQRRIAQFGAARQTAKGTYPTAATYRWGLSGGRVVEAEVNEEDLTTTWGSRVIEGHDRLHVLPGASAEFVALPQFVGLLLFGAAGSVATAGIAAPYTHTITHGDEVPYITLFGRQATDYFRVQDAKVDELELSWDTTGALRGSASFKGLALVFDGTTASTATTDERLSGGTLKGVGGTFTIEGATATVRSGSIKVANNLEAINGSDATLPKDVFTGLQEVSVSLTIVPDDMNLWRRVITGSATGVAVSPIPQYGAVQIRHVLDANTDLAFASSRLKFATEMVEADPGGGPAEVALEGVVAAPATGQPYTFTLRNAVASY